MYHEWKDSILLVPEGTYNKDLPKYKRAEAPVDCEFKQSTKLVQDARTIASPIRRFQMFIKAYDEKTKTMLLVPDFEEYDVLTDLVKENG
ncbi:hypothetical protein F8M41_022668 [Gigaspora margarita]|uniref:Uncharacterized protein n=1 Tax=Gigaspora margarita TaxID=4874 RepID=A0A8H4B159_GIGMA|nr:hypothetical protein F8M41_022668 [Gigaspora margarita]